MVSAKKAATRPAIEVWVARSMSSSSPSTDDHAIVSTAIMAESAKLAQAWNQVTINSSTQFTELLSKVFDSKIMRNFEAAKQTVMLSFDAFKASTQVLIANADLEGKYICPMCPGVESDHPAACPKCGMSKLPHAACDNCGYVSGGVALVLKEQES